MPANFRPLATDADLDGLLRDSHDRPVIVFKHSETCGISRMAEALIDEHDMPAPVHRVIVQRARPVSDRLSREVGVRHESPQALVLHRGRVAWHSSHAGVTGPRVAQAWMRAAADAQPSRA